MGRTGQERMQHSTGQVCSGPRAAPYIGDWIDISPLGVLEAGSPNQGVSRVSLPVEALEEESASAFPAPGGPGIPWLVAPLL